jgi:hypothetical protein
VSFVRDNLHKRWPFRRLLCLIGRHDYELARVEGERSALLFCFYCPQTRLSTLPAHNGKA